jgi:hypothetical protein
MFGKTSSNMLGTLKESSQSSILPTILIILLERRNTTYFLLSLPRGIKFLKKLNYLLKRLSEGLKRGVKFLKGKMARERRTNYGFQSLVMM